jgi:hypothetical protein
MGQKCPRYRRHRRKPRPRTEKASSSGGELPPAQLLPFPCVVTPAPAPPRPFPRAGMPFDRSKWHTFFCVTPQTLPSTPFPRVVRPSSAPVNVSRRILNPPPARDAVSRHSQIDFWVPKWAFLPPLAQSPVLSTPTSAKWTNWKGLRIEIHADIECSRSRKRALPRPECAV